MENDQLKKWNFIVRLKAKHFMDTLSCTGKQLTEILGCIHSKVKPLDWYIFDMYGSTESSLQSLFPNYTNPYSKEEYKICKMKNNEQFLNATMQVHQFERGVFIGIEKDSMVDWDLNLLPETEENEGIQHPLGIIEIRAFDCSYFEVYGTDISLVETLINRFNVSSDEMQISSDS